MKSRAAVAFAAGEPLKIVEIDVAPPQKGEVLVKITHTGVCHTDAFTLSGEDRSHKVAGAALWEWDPEKA